MDRSVLKASLEAGSSSIGVPKPPAPKWRCVPNPALPQPCTPPLLVPSPPKYLGDAEGDVADVEAPGLPRHLAAHHRHRRGGDSQTVGGHGGQQRRGRDLPGSWKMGREGAPSGAGGVRGEPERALGGPWVGALTLHGFVLHGGDVLEARGGHIPVLANLLLLLVAGGSAGGRQSRVRGGAEHPLCPPPTIDKPPQTHLRGPERLRGDLQQKRDSVTVSAGADPPL